MSKTVDERVVSMEFDNSRFERNVKTSMSTLDKLKQSLKLDGAAKGLENVGSAAKKFDFNPLSKGAEAVTAKFSALEVMGVTALANITNSAVNTGKSLIKAFTIDPIKSGFQEYETQINAVQTILANTSSKGTSLDQVNAALDELNHYADKTIYNFTEMTRNIGTFTAAGIDLDTSVSAIKGIANLAAVSGSNSQQASTAMYQLSQALAAGTVKLQDWNSVVNAGMGGQVFQDALKDTARVHGIAVDQMIEDEGSFRETLQKGWITSDILTETLAKFTGDLNESQLKTMGYTEDQIKAILKMGETANDAATKVKTFSQLMDTLKEAVQSGWTQTWELIVGDFEEAKVLWTSASDFFGEMIQKSADARNALLEGALGSKWDQFEKQINDAGIATDTFQEKLVETAKEHGIAIDDMISKEGSLTKVITKGMIPKEVFIDTLKKFVTESSNVSSATEDMSGKLEEFQKVVDQVWQGDFKNGEDRIKALSEAGYDYAKVQELVNKTIDGHRLTLEDLSVEQLKSVGYTEEEANKIRKLAEEAEKAGTPLNELLDSMGKPSGRELLIDSVKNSIQAIIKPLQAIDKAWKEIFTPMNSDQLYSIIEGFHKFTEYINDTAFSENNLKKLTATFKGLFSIVHLFESIVGGALKTGLKLLGKLLGGTDKNVLDLTESIGNSITKFHDWVFENDLITKGFEKLSDVIVNCGGILKAWGKRIKEVGSSIGYNITKKFPEATDCVKYLSVYFKDLNNLRFSKIISNIQMLYESILSDFSKMGISFDPIFDLINSLGDRFKTLIETFKGMDKITFSGVWTAIKQFAKGAVQDFGEILPSIDNVKNALKRFKDHVGNVLEKAGVPFKAFEKKVKGFVDKIKEIFKNFDLGSALVVAFSAGYLFLMWKFAKFVGNLSTFVETIKDMVSGAIGLFDGLTDVVKGCAKVLNGFSWKLKSEALINVAKAIGVLAVALTLLAFIPTEKLWSAMIILGIVAAGLLAFMGVMAFIDKVTGGGNGSKGMLAIAQSVMILVMALKAMEKIDKENIWTNTGALIAMMGALVMLSTFMSMYAPTLFVGSKSMIGLAVSILILTGALKVISTIDINAMEDAVTTLGWIMGLLGGLVVSISKWGKDVDKMGKSLLGMATALLVMTAVIAILAKMDKDVLLFGGLKLLGLLVIVAGMVAISKLAGQYASEAGSMIAKMAVGLLVLTGVIAILGHMDDPDALEQGIVAIGKIMFLFAGIIAVSKFAGEHASKAGTMLIKMSVAIMLLSGVIAILSFLKPEGLRNAVIAVSVLMIVFAGMVALTHFAKDTAEMNKMLITFCVAISTLGLAIGILSLINPTKLAGATAALVAVMAMFGVLIYSTKYASQANDTLKVMTMVIAALGITLYMLGDLPIESTLSSAVALSILLLALAGSMKIISGVQSVSNNVLKAMGILIAFVGVLGLVISGLSTLPMTSVIPIALSISMLMLAMAGALKLISGIQSVSSSALIAMGVMTVVVGVLGVIMCALSGLPIETTLANVAALSVIMLAMAAACRIANNSIVGAAAMIVMSVGIKAIAGALLMLSSVRLDQMIVSVSGLAATLVALGIAGAVFGSAAPLFLAGGAALIVMSIGLLAISAGLLLLSSVGLDQMIVSVGGLAAALVVLGASTAIFGAAAPLMLTGTVVMIAMAAAVALLGAALLVLGPGMNAVSAALVPFVNAWIQAITAVIQFVGQLPSIMCQAGTNFVLGFVLGIVNAIGTVVQAVAAVGKSAVDAICSFLGIHSPSTVAQQIGSYFGEGFSLGLDGSEGLVSSSAANLGNLSIDSFTSQFGEYLNAGSTSGTNYANGLSGTSDFASSMGDILGSSSLDSVGSYTDLFGTEGMNAGNLFGDGLVSGTDATSGALNTSMDGLINEVVSKNGSFQVSGSDLMTNMASGMTGKKGTVTGAIGGALVAGLGTANGKQGGFKAAGSTLITNLAGGMSGKKGDVAKTVGNVLTNSLNSSKGFDGKFKTVGKNIIAGLASGIKEKASKAVEAAKGVVSSALEGAKNLLKIHSPSKEFAKVGMYSDLGLVQGLESFSGKVKAASEGVGKTALDTMQAAVSKIGDISGIDAEPTISPVVDMSSAKAANIQLGADIGTLLSSPVDSLSRVISDAQESIDASNGRVIEAINNLRSDLNDLLSGDEKETVLYVDGKKLASSIAKPMDRALSALAKRGAY